MPRASPGESVPPASEVPLLGSLVPRAATAVDSPVVPDAVADDVGFDDVSLTEIFSEWRLSMCLVPSDRILATCCHKTCRKWQRAKNGESFFCAKDEVLL